MNRMFLRGIVVGFFLCLTGSLAFGQSNRTWVSGGGTDPGTCAATVCTRSAPCATFQCALAATNPGGEIDALDSGDFGPLTGANSIAKSVSIVAQGVVAGIQQAPFLDAIDVTGSNVVVVLRGLTLDGVGAGNDGIFFDPDGGELHIEDCTINGWSAGILVQSAGSSKVFIKDTVVRNNSFGTAFEPSGPATVIASLDNVRIENNNGEGVQAIGNATVSVRNSVAAGNGIGFIAEDSGPGRPAVINLESTIASGNGTVVDAAGANSTINMSNVTVVNNTTGLSATNGGHIVSFGNNKVTDNTTNGSPTKTIAQH
jgi:hypothetical protein